MYPCSKNPLAPISQHTHDKYIYKELFLSHENYNTKIVIYYQLH